MSFSFNATDVGHLSGIGLNLEERRRHILKQAAAGYITTALWFDSPTEMQEYAIELEDQGFDTEEDGANRLRVSWEGV